MLEESLYVSGLLALGAILKRSLPAGTVRYIPLITWSIGIILWCANNGWHQWPKAIIIAATATGIHSAGKNTLQALLGDDLEKEADDDQENR